MGGAGDVGECLLEAPVHRPQREVAGAQNVEYELLLAAVQVRARQRDLADGDTLEEVFADASRWRAGIKK